MHVCISHFKMLDDGTILFLANYVYTYSVYTITNCDYFQMVCSYSPFELCPDTPNPKSAPMSYAVLYLAVATITETARLPVAQVAYVCKGRLLLRTQRQ